jgi:heme/copper-type cytochrome/quinol oxidase subunit 4
MVVIGSGVLWVRFKEAHVPAIQAVSMQSRDEVLVQGAQTTLIFVLIALAVVAWLYIADGRDLKAAKTKRKKAEEHQAKEADRSNPATSDVRLTGDPSSEGNSKPQKKPKNPPEKQADAHAMEVRTLVAITALPILGVIWAVLFTDLDLWWVVALAALAGLLWAGCYWIGYDSSKNFWALAAAVFVSVIVFSAVAGYLIVKEQKFIQGVAVLRGESNSDLTGFYVAANGEDLFVATGAGRNADPATSKAIQRIRLGESVSYMVGPLESVEDAEATAAALMVQLRSEAAGNASDAKAGTFPSWVPPDVLGTFTSDVKPQSEVTGEPLCLMRYADTVQTDPRRPYWTSCNEAEALATVQDARQRLALPIRFQQNYTMRIKVEIPVGKKMHFLEGGTAPQCGGGPGAPCGNRYAGGGLQYWIENPKLLKVSELRFECTHTNADQTSVWERHKC